MADPINLTAARQRIAAEDVAKLHQLERELVRVIDGVDPVAPGADKDEVVAKLAQRVEETRAVVAPKPSIEEEAAALAAEKKRQIQVEAEAIAILIADPEIDTSELEAQMGEKQTETEANSVTPSRG